jgi:hypothetical protein
MACNGISLGEVLMQPGDIIVTKLRDQLRVGRPGMYKSKRLNDCIGNADANAVAMVLEYHRERDEAWSSVKVLCMGHIVYVFFTSWTKLQ